MLLAMNWIIRVATDGRIGAVARAFRQLAPIIATGESLQFLAQPSSSAPITPSPHLPITPSSDPCLGSLRVDVAPLKRLKTVARWVSGDPLMLSFSWNVLATMVTDLFGVVYEYLNLAFLLDANGVYFGARDLRAHGAALVRVISAIGEVDAAISVASYRAGQAQWTRPRFGPAGGPAVLTDARHPLVEDAVPNTITLRPAHGILVTGSNMSGKSTFLRTVGVTAVLAQTIHTCLAADYEAPIFAVRSCIGRADDLVAGKSYYIVEVEVLLALVRASVGTAPHLFLLDELFRGTNAVERIAAGLAVLSELVAAGPAPKPHVVIAATHDGELVDLLPDVFAAYHFGDAVESDGLVFDHRLRPGPATSRNAIALLRIHGAPQTLLDRALACATTLDRERGTTVEAR
jgi:DNA mismatch repair ATPase MutS